MAITGVTRRALFADLANIKWWGHCRDEVEFMGPAVRPRREATDSRFKTAREDFWQHRLNNADWSDDDIGVSIRA